MPLVASGSAQIEHRDTGEVFLIDAADLDWVGSSSFERDMGFETQYVAEAHHPTLGTLVWNVVEYPEGSIAGEPLVELNGHVLVRNFSFDVEGEEEGYADDAKLSDFDADIAEQVIREWFFENYEDPAVRLPYISSEGGYQWIHGGPYSALEAIQEHFSDDYEWSFLDQVASSIVEESGNDAWSPQPQEDFYDQGEQSEEQLAQAIEARSLLAEELVQNFETGLFDVRTVEIKKPDLFAATLAQVVDAINDVVAASSNGLNEGSLEIRKLRRTLTRYADNPQRIEMDFTTVHNAITAKIVSEDLPPSDENTALLTALQEGAQGIRATDLRVAENRKLLQEQALREITPKAEQLIADAAPVLLAVTEGRLHQQLIEDTIALAPSASKNLPQVAAVTWQDSIAANSDEKIRFFGRVARMFAVEAGRSQTHNFHTEHRWLQRRGDTFDAGRSRVARGHHFWDHLYRNSTYLSHAEDESVSAQMVQIGKPIALVRLCGTRRYSDQPSRRASRSMSCDQPPSRPVSRSRLGFQTCLVV